MQIQPSQIVPTHVCLFSSPMLSVSLGKGRLTQYAELQCSSGKGGAMQKKLLML